MPKLGKTINDRLLYVPKNIHAFYQPTTISFSARHEPHENQFVTKHIIF